MATDVCWEVTMNGSLLGQQCNNVFFYRGVELTDPTPIDIAQAFYEQVWPLLQVLVTNDYELETIEVRDILDSASPAVLPVAEVSRSALLRRWRTL